MLRTIGRKASREVNHLSIARPVERKIEEWDMTGFRETYQIPSGVKLVCDNTSGALYMDPGNDRQLRSLGIITEFQSREELGGSFYGTFPDNTRYAGPDLLAKRIQTQLAIYGD